MGQITLAEFRDEIAGSVQKNESDIGSTLLDRWIHRAMYEFGYKFPFRELEGLTTFDTVQAQSEYTIASGSDINISDFRAIRDEGIYKTTTERTGKLIPETRDRWLKNTDLISVEAQGNIRYYHKYGGSIFVRPVPDATIVSSIFHYYIRIATLADGEVSVFGDEWDEAILLGGQYRALRHAGDLDRYKLIRNDYLAAVRSRSIEQDLEEFPEGGIDPAHTEEDLVSEEGSG